MRTRTAPSILAIAAILGACSPGRVAVTAELDATNPEGGGTITQPLALKEVQLVPFNRDAIFDSLTANAATAEPPIPDSVVRLIDEVQVAQSEWRAADSRWATVRDSMGIVGEQTNRFSSTSAEYRQSYNKFVDLEAEEGRLLRNKEALFEEFTSLQQRTDGIFRDLRLARERWAEDAFADYGTIVATRLRSMGREIAVDTTDASGTVTFTVPPGEWWVYARHPLPFQELYWNIPIVAIRGETIEVRLTRATAEERRTLR
jgi:hypothetical protein